MTPRDHYTDTLRRRERAEEDRYFAERDRRLIEELHRQHPPPSETDEESTTGQPEPGNRD